jgi:hypothetical protein
MLLGFSAVDMDALLERWELLPDHKIRELGFADCLESSTKEPE